MPTQIELHVAHPETIPVRRSADEPLRILVMGDFSGRAHREPPTASHDLACRTPLAVDVDNLDAVMARLAPKLRLPLGVDGAGIPVTISFCQLDDFHPDALYQRLELFQALRHSRSRLLNPASFAQAVTELSPTLPEPAPQELPASSSSEGEGEMLERLLGKAPTPAASQPDRSVSAIQGLLQNIVQPHIVHSDPRQSAWIEAVDAAIGEQLRAILHQPVFQALEASWRSVHQLVSGEGGDEVRVYLLDVTQQELMLDLRTAGGDPKATELYTLLVDCGVQMPDGQPWSLLVGDYSFAASPEDIALLAMLGSVAACSGGAFVAAADPQLLGAESAMALGDPQQWMPLNTEAEQNWQALRQCAVAPWIGLALPRIVLRLPYGQKTDSMESIEFEEMPLGRDPDMYLWGNPAFVCARLIAMAFVESGSDFSLGDVLELDDFPAHVYEEAGERLMQPATEALLNERAMQSILSHGLMPLLGHRQLNMIRLVRFQSLANPPTELAGVGQ